MASEFPHRQIHDTQMLLNTSSVGGSFVLSIILSSELSIFYDSKDLTTIIAPLNSCILNAFNVGREIWVAIND